MAQNTNQMPTGESLRTFLETNPAACDKRSKVERNGCCNGSKNGRGRSGGMSTPSGSPIDLISDFIPVLGYLDDVILLPLAILLAVRLVPPDLMAEHRAAAARAEGKPVSRAGAAFIVTLWLLVAGALIWWLWPHVAW
jgi:hypothetical protein